MDPGIRRQIMELESEEADLWVNERYKQALPIAKQLCELIRDQMGEKHPRYRARLERLSELYEKTGDRATARQLALQVQSLPKPPEAHLGTVPQSVVDLHQRALHHHKAGRNAEAQSLYLEALQIAQKPLGRDHPGLIPMLSNLALLYHSEGDFAAALLVLERALVISESTLGYEHPSVAKLLNQLARHHCAQGDYVTALPLYKRALAIYEFVWGDENPDTVTTLKQMAVLHQTQGDFAEALALYERALVIHEQEVGAEHAETAATLLKLASLHRAMGHYPEALPLYERALAIYEKVLGAEHSKTGSCLHSLAALHHVQGRYALALPLYERALAIREKTAEIERPNTAIYLNNLASLHHAQGNYAVALPLAEQALAICKQALGPEHPNITSEINTLAILLASTSEGPSEQAFSLVQRASASIRRFQEQIFAVCDGRFRMKALDQTIAHSDLLLSLACRQLTSREINAASLDYVLGVKALETEAFAPQRDAVLSEKYPQFQTELQQLTALVNRIVHQTLAGLGREGIPAYRKLLDDWADRKEQLEIDLARQIPEMALHRKLAQADTKTVSARMPEGSILLEFVRFRPVHFQAVWNFETHPSGPERYIAFLLRAGQPDQVRMFDLGETSSIDPLIAAFRAAILANSAIEIRTCGAQLRGLLLDPLLPHLPKSTSESLPQDPPELPHLFIAPDGELSRLAFGILPTDAGSYLLDHYRISYLTVGRDILRFGQSCGITLSAPIVLADPNFELQTPPSGTPSTWQTVHRKTVAQKPGAFRRPSSPSAPPVTVPIVVPVRSHAAPLSCDFDRTSLHFDPLPGSRLEGQKIAARFAVSAWLEQDAQEAYLRARTSPRIVHLATHAFFLEDQKRQHDLPFALRGFSLSQEHAGWDRMENPLLRSGLALAGVNTWLRGGSPPAEAEDGLLTAEDVTGLDLHGTELAVLSACDTGSGEGRRGENVFGMRRAFVLAGAQTLVMSLWKVPDLPAAILMDHFYARLHAGVPRDIALHEACRYVRNATIGRIRDVWLTPERIQEWQCIDAVGGERLEELSRYPNEHRPFQSPYYWAAFLCQGEVTPLS